MKTRSFWCAGSKVLAASARFVGLAACTWAASSCNEIDTTRIAPPKATLGDDMFGVLCDRLGASSFTEDLEGRSYQGICHYDDKGKYGSKIDTAFLPEPSNDEGLRARRLSIAKLETLARRRSELIRAFNAAFPDAKIQSPTGGNVRLHDALLELTQRLTDLYDKNPFDPKADPLMPTSTQSLGRLFRALGSANCTSEKDCDGEKAAFAREALQNMTSRQGYRPYNVALGAIRPLLAYPNLRGLTKASLEVLGPNGSAVPELQDLLAVAKEELKRSTNRVSTSPTLTIDAATAQPNRPRSIVEVAAAMLLQEHPSFSAAPNDASRFIVRRDKRGFVVPVGNTPGQPGTVPAPFSDVDGDGLADIDAFGRFIDGAEAPLVVDRPFQVPGAPPGGAVDAFGRPSNPVYQYIDTSRTMLAAVARSLIPLLDATSSDAETMMYTMGGAYIQYGPREDAQYDYASEEAGQQTGLIRRADEACDGCFKYKRFRGEDSPLADLAHASGQILADPDSDAILASLMDLVQNHEQVVARLLGAALRIRELAAQHDEAARDGKEPFAEMPYETPIWDEIAQVVHRIVQRPGLTRKLLESLADDTVVTPFGGAAHEGKTMANFFRNRDFLTYDPNNLNGPAINVTVGGASVADPQTPVDQTKPKVGDNRSIMQRSFQVIHDANGAKLCNRAGAVAIMDLGFLGHLTWPILGDYDECELFEMNQVAIVYLNSILPDWHPKRTELQINDQTFLSDLIDFGGTIGLDTGGIFQNSSGITGLTLFPSSPALNRLLFFGADSQGYSMPDLDPFRGSSNSETNDFISNIVEPASPVVCPKDAMGVEQCSDPNDLYRVRDFGTMFVWERLGYFDYLRPLVMTFANESCTTNGSGDLVCDVADTSGEQLFVDLLDILNRHWPGKEHGAECNGSGNAATNKRYCSGAGVNTYEPLLADSFDGDLIPALHEFAKAASQLSTITVARGPNKGQTWTGAEVLEKVTRILFDQSYAGQSGVTDRRGNKGTQWTDGTPQGQATPYSLFADALHKIDVRFDRACDCDGLTGQDLSSCQANAQSCKTEAQARKAEWKRARSQMVDQFFGIDGEGTVATFRNKATPRALLTILQTVREQLNANCPNREADGQCEWARKDLGRKMSDTISGPLFAGIMNVQEQIRKNEGARRELERLLTFILEAASSGDAFQSTLASFADILQIIRDDGHFSHIFVAASEAASPEHAKNAKGELVPGCADTTIKMLKALTSDDYDPHHVLDHILPALVTPMDGGQGTTPIELFIDVIADVHREDAGSAEPLHVDDYSYIWKTVEEFMTHETRGLEQLYYIVQNRPRE
jgi:hypothetical protein